MNKSVIDTYASTHPIGILNYTFMIIMLLMVDAIEVAFGDSD
jgi:hypothetical protein